MCAESRSTNRCGPLPGRHMQGLQTLFRHYSQTIALAKGRRMTFDAIAKDTTTMNKAAFMRCCKVLFVVAECMCIAKLI